MNTHNIEKIIDYFSYVKKWLKTPTNEEENQRLIIKNQELVNNNYKNEL